MILTTIFLTLFLTPPNAHADELESLVKSFNDFQKDSSILSPLTPGCASSELAELEEPEVVDFFPRPNLQPILPTTTPFIQNRPRANTCTRRQSPAQADQKDAGFSNISNFPCNGQGEKNYSGVSIAGADYHDLDFLSEDGSKAGTYIYLTEAVLPQDSYNVKSMMFLLPRKGIPAAQVQGNEIHVTLQTGEVVVYDRQTKKIKSGALLEGPSDPSKDRFTRKPPNIHYKGAGISIRVDHRYEHPTSAKGDLTAEVKQNGRTCSVPRERLWNTQGEALELDDSKVVNLLNQLCPAKKGEALFSI